MQNRFSQNLHRFEKFREENGNKIATPSPIEGEDFEKITRDGVEYVVAQNFPPASGRHLYAYSLFEFPSNVKHLFSKSKVQYDNKAENPCVQICFKHVEDKTLPDGLKIAKDCNTKLRWFSNCRDPVYVFTPPSKKPKDQTVTHWALYPDREMTVSEYQTELANSFRTASVCGMIDGASEPNDFESKDLETSVVMSTNESENVEDSWIITIGGFNTSRRILYEAIQLYVQGNILDSEKFEAELLLCWLYEHEVEDLFDEQIYFLAVIAKKIMELVYEEDPDSMIGGRLDEILLKLKSFFHWYDDIESVLYHAKNLDNFKNLRDIYVIRIEISKYPGLLSNSTVDTLHKNLLAGRDNIQIHTIVYYHEEIYIIVCTDLVHHLLPLPPKEISIPLNVVAPSGFIPYINLVSVEVKNALKLYPNDTQFFAVQKHILDLIDLKFTDKDLKEMVSATFFELYQKYYFKPEAFSGLELYVFEGGICFLRNFIFNSIGALFFPDPK